MVDIQTAHPLPMINDPLHIYRRLKKSEDLERRTLNIEHPIAHCPLPLAPI